MLSGPARALGIEMLHNVVFKIHRNTSGSARALGIEMHLGYCGFFECYVGACKGFTD